MNITKHGAESKKELMTEEFECKRCGCKFTADDDEYYVEKGTCFTTSASLTYTYSAKVTDIYVCSCPECHKIVTKTKERINENPCITLTSQKTDSSRTILTACMDCSNNPSNIWSGNHNYTLV